MSVLIVDDQPESTAEDLAKAIERLNVQARSINPDAVSRASLKDVDAILVDYKLDYWVKPRNEVLAQKPAPKQRLADQPADGLALAAVLRSQIQPDTVCGVALLSANLEDLVRGLSPSANEHVAARVSGLDWAFGKKAISDAPPQAERIVSFAKAVRSVRETWSRFLDEEDREPVLRELLKLPDGQTWSKTAARDLHAAQAPIHTLADASHGLSILRWLGQRVLPYPTFLMDCRRVAAACGLHPAALDDHLDSQELAEILGHARYEGPLACFLGPRWWRAGVHDTIRAWTGSSAPSLAAAEELEGSLGLALERLDPLGAVLCVDEKLQPCADPVARERAMRVQLDDWPAFAAAAWMSEDLIGKHSELIALVDPADRVRLEDD